MINQCIPPKILFVVTSNDKKGDTGQPTGFYLSEVTHPWEVLHKEGFEIEFASPEGGKAPVEAVELEDGFNAAFWNDPACREWIEHTLKPEKVNPDDYVAVYFAGGHGTMWDFPDNPELASIVRRIYEKGGVVSAVCHGPSALVNVKLSDGSYLVAGKKINAFTNEEEKAVKMDKVVPFLLEDKLRERGARFEKSAPWKSHVAIDGRLVTGQNPQSASDVGLALIKLLKDQAREAA